MQFTLGRSIRLTVLCGAAMLGTVTTAGAAAPPPTWGNQRLLTCDGEQVGASFTPGGVFTAFNVVDSHQVIVPKYVEVVFPGETEPVVTLDVPGFRNSRATTVTCTYTDPAGLSITLVGISGSR